jgi:hypothetical protein
MKNIEIIENRELYEKILRYYRVFGLKATERKFGVTRHTVAVIKSWENKQYENN